MTYNILNGGKDRFSLILAVIKEVQPDYLTINEANTFIANDRNILKEVARQIQLPHYDIALSGEYDYHVAVFSKNPFKKIHKLKPLMRACVALVIETEFGDMSVASVHLTPYSEDLRLSEIDLILNHQQAYQNRLLMGDMNSLSPDDGYSNEMLKDFNEMRRRKFTSNGKLRFDAIRKIISLGYHDAAVLLKRNKENTVPTLINEYDAHSNMRLDYIFVSEAITPYVKHYAVVKNYLTRKASDHYPVVIELSK